MDVRVGRDRARPGVEGALSHLRIRGVAKRFAETPVLEGVSLEIAEGEVLALLGPSGSGKTTLLRILAGFETADAGEVWLGDERIDGRRPERRGFGMVFQHYALFPHLTVGGNVAFGLETRRLGKAEIAHRVAMALERVDLGGFEKRPIGELSGGQQQRVALARALAPEPRVLLLDEPLSNLDPTLRERTRRELAEQLRAIGVTTVLVTHEQEEAFELGERVALLHDGRLEQVGTPEQLYRDPATRFVAGFVGHGSFLPATVARTAPVLEVSGIELPGGRMTAELRDGAGDGQSGEVFLRPEMLELCAPEEAGAVAGRVARIRFGGAASWVAVTLASGSELEVLIAGATPPRDAAVGVRRRAAARPVFFPADETA